MLSTKSNALVHRLGQHAPVFLFACFIWTLTYWVLWRMPTVRRFQLPAPKSASPKHSSTITAHDMGISQEEWDRLQKAVDWTDPDHEITELNLSTSPVHTTFSIVGFNENYKVGDKIRVTITARDHNKNLKSYGGDFFQVKLFNFNLKASVYGEVIDHRNGTYTIDFLLPWEGQAQVSVRLMYSSEFVKILKKYWKSSVPRSNYIGYFQGPGPDGKSISEVVECNIKWGSDSWSKGNCCCEYKDVKTETVWQCERPQILSCDNWVYHQYGSNPIPFTPSEMRFIESRLSNAGIAGDSRIINVLNNTAGTGKTERCRPGLKTPVPAGFYYEDVWKSFVCDTKHFSLPQITNCLRNKVVHILGDSTTRQWFEFFQENLPGLNLMNPEVDPKTGPFMAVELKNNIILYWRPHGFPLRFHKIPAADLHYISNEIDYITGGRNTVVTFTVSAHLVFHQLTFYVHKVAKIRQAVIRLLMRAPETTVIIKSGNTGFNGQFDYGCEWYRMQLNTVMMEMFRDIDKVFYFDVWQMTSCHYTQEKIHPAPVIVSNEVDMLLSFICPS